MDEFKGWAFPIKADEASGKITEVWGDELIKQSIIIILTTRKGERFLKPEFGCGLSNFVFREINYTTLKQIEAEAASSIGKWEKRITDLSVMAEVDAENPGTVKLNINYKTLQNESGMHLTYLFNMMG